MGMGEHLEFMRAVRGLVLAGDRFRARAGRRRGLSPTGITALASLHLDGAQSPSQLAALLEITTASATELLDKLAHLGLVTRRPHPRDRRKLLIELTDHGTEQITDILDAFAARLEPLADQLDPHERTAILDFVQAARVSLHDPNPTPDDSTAS
jgi:DNA-binding MarR family transcriptional regulator